ncbi:MAG: hypothetical protein AAGJ94_10090 [Pseudomonadota bacterium]
MAVSRAVGALFIVLILASCGTSAITEQLAPLREVKETITPETIAGKTILTYDSQHGTQVEYVGSDWRVYLWYPGNTSVVKGLWKLDRDPLLPFIETMCFQYVTRSRRTGLSRLTRWSCSPFGAYRSDVRDFAEGDVFGLAGGRLPFELDDRLTSIEQLQSQLAWE